MNSEAHLFNHEGYGEAFIGMAAHASNMTQLDRMISEDCFGGGTNQAVLAPHINVKSACRYHLRPEVLQRKIQSTFAQAVTLCDCWSIIEATPKMVATFILWINAKGINAAVTYFESLAMQLAEIEGLEEDCESLDENPEDSDAPAAEFGYHPIGCEISTTAACPDCGCINNTADEFITDDTAEIFCDACDNVFTVHKFIPVASWESVQPKWYRNLLRGVRIQRDLDELKDTGKRVFDNKNLNHGQSGVFWYEYHKTEAKLMDAIGRYLSVTARNLLKSIATSDHVSSLGCLLFKIQDGTTQLNNPPSKYEWTIIWAAYKDRKKDLKVAAATTH